MKTIKVILDDSWEEVGGMKEDRSRNGVIWMQRDLDIPEGYQPWPNRRWKRSDGETEIEE